MYGLPHTLSQNNNKKRRNFFFEELHKKILLPKKEQRDNKKNRKLPITIEAFLFSLLEHYITYGSSFSFIYFLFGNTLFLLIKFITTIRRIDLETS